jgi:hypothetical protein
VNADDLREEYAARLWAVFLSFELQGALDGESPEFAGELADRTRAILSALMREHEELVRANILAGDAGRFRGGRL